MDFDNVVIKDSPGLCRCCLSEGCYKDLGSEYIWMGEPEIYAEMLLECFDINISQHNNGPNGPNRLICEVCITRLRDACNFKKQVMDSERKFVDMLARGDFIAKVSNNAPMKAETSEAEAIEEDHIEVEYLENDMEYDYEDIKEEDSDGEIKEKPARASATSTRKAREEPKRKKTQTESKQRVRKTTKKDIPESLTTSGTQGVRLEVRRSLIELLSKTTVMPFEYSNKYRCFYCDKKFNEAEALKLHTLEHKEYLPIRINPKTFDAVKLDVSYGKCRVCSETFEGFDTLVDHIIRQHKSNFNKDFMRNFHCFKLNDEGMSCLDCGMKFQLFRPLLFHAHKIHTTNRDFLCDLCGQNFYTPTRLQEHHTRAHSSDGFKCKMCDEVLPSDHYRRKHVVEAHKDLKCPVCSESFKSRYLRQRHVQIVHGGDDAFYKCDKCPLRFSYQNQVMRHDRRVHMKEKPHVCEVCDAAFFNKHCLKLHMRSHNGERPHKCEVCQKHFVRKTALAIHMRIHNDDKRFVCKECGQAFVQGTSLKYHMRRHQ